MNVLIINTAVNPALVVVAGDGKATAHRKLAIDKTLGTELLKATDELLKETSLSKADIDRVAVHPGPGKYFMALRTGVITATLFAQTVAADLVEIQATDVSEMSAEAQAVDPVPVIVPKYKA